MEQMWCAFLRKWVILMVTTWRMMFNQQILHAVLTLDTAKKWPDNIACDIPHYIVLVYTGQSKIDQCRWKLNVCITRHRGCASTPLQSKEARCWAEVKTIGWGVLSLFLASDWIKSSSVPSKHFSITSVGSASNKCFFCGYVRTSFNLPIRCCCLLDWLWRTFTFFRRNSFVAATY